MPFGEENVDLFENYRPSFPVVPKGHKFSEGWDPLSDVVLLVGDYRFYIHKALLSVNSPVFRTMFTSDFKEAHATEIPLPGKKPLPVYQMLLFMYYSVTESAIENEPLDVAGVLELANEYDIQPLKNRCERRLMELSQDYSPTIDALLLVQKYGSTELLSAVVEKLTGRGRILNLERHPRFDEINVENKFKLYKRHIEHLELKCWPSAHVFWKFKN